MDRQQAGIDITDLERLTGAKLSEIPIFIADQWGASVRDSFNDLNAALDRADMARAAFGGAYIVASLLINAAPQRVDAVSVVSHLLRWLYERGEVNR